MALENLEGPDKFINDLVESNPVGATDQLRTVDDHIRGIKNVLKNTFPLVDGKVNMETSQLNQVKFLDGLSEPVIKFRIEAGTRMVFVQPAAPSGWTQDRSSNDRVLRLTDGLAGSPNAGGSEGGSWVISGLSSAGVSLTIDQMPSHNHILNFNYISDRGDSEGRSGRVTSGSSLTQSNGRGQPHSHAIGSNGQWRPRYVNVIVCSRNE